MTLPNIDNLIHLGMPAALATELQNQVAPITNSANGPVSTALDTVGAGTITAAGIVGGATTRGGAQSATAFTDTTATAALIIAALPNAGIGQSWYWEYRNHTDGNATITGGTGVTVSIYTVVPKNSWAKYLVKYTAAATVTILGVAIGPISVQSALSGFGTADNGTTQTLTAAMVSGFNQTFHVSTGGTTPSLTLPLATDLIAAIPGWQTGQSYTLRVINRNSGTATVVTNTGITTSGTLTLATNTWRDFVVTMASATTVTVTAAGTGTDS